MTRLRRSSEGDRGSALVMVVGVSVVVMAFLQVLVTSTLTSQINARKAYDVTLATAAAQAGIQDYLSRLTENSDYWQSGETDATNLAFTPAGRTVPGSIGSGSRFRYDLVSSADDIAATGSLRLLVTGTSKGGSAPEQSRSLTATFTAGGLPYALLTDKEVISPALLYLHTNTSCAAYWYAGRSAIANADVMQQFDPFDCYNLPWTTTDVVDGPMHSNDALRITSSPTFTGPVTTSWPATSGATGATWWGGAAGVTGAKPTYAPVVALPSGGTASLKAYVSPDVDGSTATPAGPGCYYTGATKITFTGTTMSVLSPYTSSAATPARCYDSSAAKRATLQTGLPIPPLIYVDSQPSASCLAHWLIPNAIGYPAGTDPLTSEFYEGDVYARESPDGLFGVLPLSLWGWAPNYCGQRGTAYVSGQTATSVTVGTQDDVVITGNLTVPAASSALIGLHARSSVFLYHPVNFTNGNIGTPVTTVQASIIAQQNSFLLQYWTHGAPLGTLTVTGSVISRFRGAMAVTNIAGPHGYSSVRYVSDPRLRTTRPPYWPSEGHAEQGWVVSTVQDR